jgi:type II secretory ATPase GspE/PulE/Tfp pilus assembly ATPase PilB-like protein
VSAAVRDAIAAGAARVELQALAARDGLVSLRADALRKVGAGLTTSEEVARVVQV